MTRTGLHVWNSGYSTVASAASGYQSPQMKGTTMESTLAEKAREATTVAMGLIEVLLISTGWSLPAER
jgi:hypothetical protein